jgi:hypothetical protein
MEEWDAEAIKDEVTKKWIVVITVDGEERQFRAYSKRSGQTLELLVKQLEEGVTTVDMKNTYGIDDNKLFHELKSHCAFDPFMEKQTQRRDGKDVWKLNLERLWEVSNGLSNPIWFGLNDSTNLESFLPELIKRDGFTCNISGIPLLEDSKGKFVRNARTRAIDHRRPQNYQGKDELGNFQLLSEYINLMKKMVCADCTNRKCEECALAFPEKTSIIYPTKEDIKVFGAFKEKHKKKWWRFW